MKRLILSDQQKYACIEAISGVMSTVTSRLIDNGTPSPEDLKPWVANAAMALRAALETLDLFSDEASS